MLERAAFMICAQDNLLALHGLHTLDQSMEKKRERLLTDMRTMGVSE
jgi:hypothetical protein